MRLASHLDHEYGCRVRAGVRGSGEGGTTEDGPLSSHLLEGDVAPRASSAVEHLFETRLHRAALLAPVAAEDVSTKGRHALRLVSSCAALLEDAKEGAVVPCDRWAAQKETARLST